MQNENVFLYFIVRLLCITWNFIILCKYEIKPLFLLLIMCWCCSSNIYNRKIYRVININLPPTFEAHVAESWVQVLWEMLLQSQLMSDWLLWLSNCPLEIPLWCGKTIKIKSFLSLKLIRLSQIFMSAIYIIICVSFITKVHKHLNRFINMILSTTAAHDDNATSVSLPILLD